VATSGAPAAYQTNEPDDCEHHDYDPQKVEKSRSRVEQEPHDEKYYRGDDE